VQRNALWLASIWTRRRRATAVFPSFSLFSLLKLSDNCRQFQCAFPDITLTAFGSCLQSRFDFRLPPGKSDSELDDCELTCANADLKESNDEKDVLKEQHVG
jgi:hypothetical protein